MSGNGYHDEKRIRTLLVDDSPNMLGALRAFLETQEAIEIVGTAHNGNQALMQVETLRPDLVLTDMVMPAMNGLELTLRLRREYPQTRVVVVTGSENPGIRLACEACGADGYLPKSRLLQDLSPEIHRIFAGLEVEERMVA